MTEAEFEPHGTPAIPGPMTLPMAPSQLLLPEAGPGPLVDQEFPVIAPVAYTVQLCW